MKTQRSEEWEFYGRSAQAQDPGRHFVLILTEADHAAMCEKAKQDIEKIVEAAGVELPKTAHIAVRRGMRWQQGMGVKELNILLQDIKEAKNHESATIWSGIATGYANAMRHFDLISEKELKDVLEVIGQAGERTDRRIEAANRPLWLRVIKKWGRA